MLHRLRETRALSLIYLCSLSLFLFSASLWWVLTTELAFQDHLLDRATSTLAGFAIQVVLLGLSIIALFVVALATLTHALIHRQAGTLLFAVLCLGLGIVGGFGDRPWFGLDGHFPLLVLVLAWLPVGIIALCVGVGLFVTGVKGLQAIRKGRWWPVAFALAIDLLLPVGLTSYTLWGRQIITSGQFPPGGFFIGNMFFVSLANFLSFLLLDLAPYLLLGALLLALAGNESSTRSWRVTRRFGVAFTLVQVVTLAAVAIWDVNLWFRGGVRIFDPTHGVWPLFGGQWIGPLLTDVLVLVVALSLALLALIHSFLVQPGEEPSNEAAQAILMHAAQETPSLPAVPMSTRTSTNLSRGRLTKQLTLLPAMLVVAALLGGFLVLAPAPHPGSSILHITDTLRASGTPVSGKPQTAFVPPTGHYESPVGGLGVTYFGSDNGNVYALQATNGKLLWHSDTGHPVYVVALVNGSVYATSGAHGDEMYALDASSGTVLWQRPIDSSIFGSVIVNGVVYLNTNDSGRDGGGGSVYALQASDGSLLWHQVTDVGMPEPLTVLDGIIYTRAADSQGPYPGAFISAWRASDGHFLWKYHLTEYADGEPAEINGVVYVVAGDGTVYALRAETGVLLWRFTDYSGVFATTSPVVVNEVVYVGTDTGIIYALQATDGKLLWHYDLPASFDNTLSLYGSPVIVNDVLYVVVNSGTVYALRAHDGSLLWSRTTLRSAFGPLIVTDGTVQVSTQENSIYALRARSGALLWQHAIGSFRTWEVQSPPRVLVNGILSVGTTDGVVTALRASDGAQLWRFSIKERAELTRPVLSASVHFDSSVPYEQALRALTDLGLQLFALCEIGWRPVGNEDSYPSMLVESTPLAPAGWLTHLKAIPGVQSVQEESGGVNCPGQPVPAPPGTTAFLPRGQIGTYIQVTFGSSVTSYERTLAAVSNLGFRLGNPCYEQAKGAKSAWSPMGQEDMFTHTHTLILATTSMNSTHWNDQLRAIADVTQVETTFDVKC